MSTKHKPKRRKPKPIWEIAFDKANTEGLTKDSTAGKAAMAMAGKVGGNQKGARRVLRETQKGQST